MRSTAGELDGSALRGIPTSPLWTGEGEVMYEFDTSELGERVAILFLIDLFGGVGR